MKNIMLKNAVILGFSGFCAKGFDFIFRAYYSRFLGQEGMGILSLGFSFHGVMLTVATAGLGVATTKVISECLVKEDYHAVKKCMKLALQLVLFISSLVIGIIFVGAEWIADNIIGEQRISTGLACLAPSILFMGVSYCLKGYFYAKRKVVAPALSEFIEQIVKGVLIYTFLQILLPKGVAYGCAGVFLGITLGEFSSCVFLFVIYVNDLKMIKDGGTAKDVNFMLFKIAFPTMITSLLGSVFRMQEEVWLVAALKQHGFSHSDSLAKLGVIHGMVMPVLVFPLTLIGSVSTLLVPEISRANAMPKKERLHKIIRKVYSFGMIAGFGIMLLFNIFSEEITYNIYGDVSIASMVRKLSIVCPLLFLNALSCSVLNGMGKQFSLLLYSLTESVLRLAGIGVLVTAFGIDGVVCVIVFANSFICLLTLWKVLTSTFFAPLLNCKMKRTT